MKIVPAGQPNQAGYSAPSSKSIQNAINAFNNGQQAPVANPSQISPEEMSAVRPPSSGEEQKVQKNTIEGTPTEKVVEPPKEATGPKEEPLSTQYAILARKEKALRAKVEAQEAATKAREVEIRAKEDALRAKEVEYQAKYISKDELLQNPLNKLGELGLTYDQLTELATNSPKPEDLARDAYTKKLEARLEALEGNHKKSVESFQEQQTQAYQQAIRQLNSEATQLVNTDASYETIKATSSVKDVVDLIEKTFKADGILMSIDEAAKLVEEELVERGLKIAGLDKIQKRLAAAKSAEKPIEPPKQSQELKTLTNAVSSTRQLSAKERAILAFKGELKK